MQLMMIQHSKDTFCDYLLAHAWIDFLDLTGKGFIKKEAEKFITIDAMKEFAKFLAIDDENPFARLRLFGIDDTNDLYQQLKQSYKNLKNQGLK